MLAIIASGRTQAPSILTYPFASASHTQLWMAAGQSQQQTSNPPSTFMSAFPRAFFDPAAPQQQQQQQQQQRQQQAAAGQAAAASPADTQGSTSSYGTAAAPAAVAVGVTHTLEWNVAAFTVPWKKQTKTILSNVGAYNLVCACTAWARVSLYQRGP